MQVSPTTGSVLTFTLLGLALSPVARAQSGQYFHLSPGDTLTVSSAGTYGTVGGSPVATPTATSYTGYSSSGDTVDNFGNFTLASGGSITNPRASSSFNAVDAVGNSTTRITGGTVTASSGGDAVFATDSATVIVTGGTITGGSNGAAIFADGGNMVSIAGGVISVGQGGVGLISSVQSTIDVFGTNFSYKIGNTTTPITSGFLPSNGAFGTITGTLLNGDPLNTTFSNDSIFEVNIGTAPAITPEPSPVIVLGLGFLALGGLAFRRRACQTATSR